MKSSRIVKVSSENLSNIKSSRYFDVTAVTASSSDLVGCLGSMGSYCKAYGRRLTTVDSESVGDGVNGDGAGSDGGRSEGSSSDGGRSVGTPAEELRKRIENVRF